MHSEIEVVPLLGQDDTLETINQYYNETGHVSLQKYPMKETEAP